MCMTGRNALVLLAAALTSSARADLVSQPPPGADRGPSIEDQRAYRQYQAQLGAVQADSRGSAPGAASMADCKLFRPDAHTVPADECMACHGLHQTHPVDLDYDAVAWRPGSGLRPAPEVVSRGVFLPDGKLRCVTCHDARSNWRYRLVLPPGAAARPAVDSRRPETFEDGPARQRALSRPLEPGADVSPTPLCKACHTLGE
jgi:hypothetical protein